MTEKTRFYILVGLLIASIALLIFAHSLSNVVIIGS
jgi:hypothetical protein